MRNSCTAIAGYSLIELLIATSLSSLLISLLLIFYTSCLRFNMSLRMSASDLESSRFACFFLRHRLCAASVRGLGERELTLQSIKATAMNDSFEVITKKDQLHYYIYVAEHSYRESQTLTSLFIKEINKPRIEIAPEIKYLRVLYGIRCQHSENICAYLRNREVVDWMQVASVKIDLGFGTLVTRVVSLYIAINKKC